MKKIWFFIVFAVVLMGNTVRAQEDEEGNGHYYRWYTRLDLGWKFGLCYYDPCDYFNEDQGTGYDIVKAVEVRTGSGFDIEAGVGYRLKKYLAVELDLNDFQGINTKVTKTGSGEGGSFSETTKFRGMVFSAIPSVVISPGFEKIDPYARFGLLIGAYPRIYEKVSETTGTFTTYYEGTYYGGIPIGYSAAVGVNFNVCKHFDVNAEVNCNGYNWSPNHYKMTKYEENGVDMLGSRTTKQTHIDFYKNFDRSVTIPDTSPNKQLKESFPFSSTEIKIGASFMF